MNKEKLEQYLNEGKSSNTIALLMGVASGSTVRHWMKKYDLKSSAKSGKKSENSIVNGMKSCNTCGISKPVSEFTERKDRPRNLCP